MELPYQNLLPKDVRRVTSEIFTTTRFAAFLAKQPQQPLSDASFTEQHHNLINFLHQKERTKLAGFRLAKRQAEFLAGRLCAKQVILQFLNDNSLQPPTSPDRILITNSESGRPMVIVDGLDNSCMPDISISHGGRYAAALAADLPCGIDVQECRDNLMRVQEKYCLPDEQRLLGKELPEVSPVKRLAHLWTAKEAAKKALSHKHMPGFLELSLKNLTTKTNDCVVMAFQVNTRIDTGLPPIVSVISWLQEEYAMALCMLAKEV